PSLTDYPAQNQFGNLLIGGDFPIDIFQNDPSQRLKIPNSYNPNTNGVYRALNTPSWVTTTPLFSLTKNAWAEIKGMNDRFENLSLFQDPVSNGTSIIHSGYFANSVLSETPIPVPFRFSQKAGIGDSGKYNYGLYSKNFYYPGNYIDKTNYFQKNFLGLPQSGMLRTLLGVPWTNRTYNQEVNYRGNFYQNILSKGSGQNLVSKGLKKGRYVVLYSVKKEMQDADNPIEECFSSSNDSRYTTYLGSQSKNSNLDFGAVKNIQPVIFGSTNFINFQDNSAPQIVKFVDNNFKYEVRTQNTTISSITFVGRYSDTLKFIPNGYNNSEDYLKNKEVFFYRKSSNNYYTSTWRRFYKRFTLKDSIPHVAIGFGVWERFGDKSIQTNNFNIFNNYMNPQVPNGSMGAVSNWSLNFCTSGSTRKFTYSSSLDRFIQNTGTLFVKYLPNTTVNKDQLIPSGFGPGNEGYHLYSQVFGSYLFDNLMMLRVPELTPVLNSSMLISYASDFTPIVNFCVNNDINFKIKPESYTDSLEVVFPNYSKADMIADTANTQKELEITAYFSDSLLLDLLPMGKSKLIHFGTYFDQSISAANKFKPLKGAAALSKIFSLRAESFTNTHARKVYGKILNPNIRLQLLDRGHATFSALNIPGEEIKRLDFFDNSFKVRIFPKPVIRITDAVVTSPAKNLSIGNHPRFNSPIAVSANGTFKIQIFSATNPSDSNYFPFQQGLKHRYLIELKNVGNSGSVLLPNNNSPLGFEGEILFNTTGLSGLRIISFELVNFIVINGVKTPVPGCKTIFSIPIRVFCTPEIPDLVITSPKPNGKLVDLYTELDTVGLFSPPNISNILYDPKYVENKVFYITYNTNINSNNLGVVFKNCTFYFEGDGGRKSGNIGSNFDDFFEVGSGPIFQGLLVNGNNDPFSAYPCGIINGPYLNLKPTLGQLTFQNCRFETACNFKMWGGIKILSTPDKATVNQHAENVNILPPIETNNKDIRFFGTTFKDMYHGLTDSLSLDLRPQDVKSSIEIVECKFNNNRIGIHIKGMPFSVNNNPAQSAIHHLSTSFYGNSFKSNPNQMKFPLERDNSKPNADYHHYGYMGVFIDNRTAKNHYNQYVFEYCSFDSLVYGIRCGDADGVPQFYSNVVSSSLGSNLKVDRCFFNSCRIAGISNYFILLDPEKEPRSWWYIKPRTSVLNSTFYIDAKPDTMIRKFCDLQPNFQFRQPSGIYAAGDLSLNNTMGTLGFISTVRPDSTKLDGQGFNGIYCADVVPSLAPFDTIKSYNTLEVKAQYFSGFQKAIVHNTKGLVNLQNNTFLDNRIAVDLYNSIKDIYLGCNTFSLSCKPDLTRDVLYDPKLGINPSCPVNKTTIGVRFNGDMRVKSNEEPNYISGKPDPNFVPSQGLNALPRGGNTWPSNYAWDGSEDPFILANFGFKLPRMPIVFDTLSTDSMEVPYIQYKASSDSSLSDQVPFDNQKVVPVWSFRNKNWHSFFDNRMVGIPFKIMYLPYSNEFVDEKMCSEYNGTERTLKCSRPNSGLKMFLVYPNEASGIFKTPQDLDNELLGLDINNKEGTFGVTAVNEFCERIRLQLNQVYPGEFDVQFTDECTQELLSFGTYSFKRAGYTEPVRTITLGCVPSAGSPTNWTPIPIQLRKGSFDKSTPVLSSLIYPNPTNQSVNINLSEYDPLQTYTVQIVDLKGVAQGSYTL
ncbi:hypothetical protein, partial [Umezakia ovalisporum]|uniref:hypothetical protein n=1 Tax=Umezakia ovalisporum TaxID=75695 RepID=UPI0039C6B8C2